MVTQVFATLVKIFSVFVLRFVYTYHCPQAQLYILFLTIEPSGSLVQKLYMILVFTFVLVLIYTILWRSLIGMIYFQFQYIKFPEEKSYVPGVFTFTGFLSKLNVNLSVNCRDKSNRSDGQSVLLEAFNKKYEGPFHTHRMISTRTFWICG